MPNALTAAELRLLSTLERLSAEGAAEKERLLDEEFASAYQNGRSPDWHEWCASTLPMGEAAKREVRERMKLADTHEETMAAMEDLVFAEREVARLRAQRAGAWLHERSSARIPSTRGPCTTPRSPRTTRARAPRVRVQRRTRCRAPSDDSESPLASRPLRRAA